MAEITVEEIEVHRYQLCCLGCPKTAIIETDDKVWLAKSVKAFKKAHKKCKGISLQ